MTDLRQRAAKMLKLPQTSARMKNEQPRLKKHHSRIANFGRCKSHLPIPMQTLHYLHKA